MNFKILAGDFGETTGGLTKLAGLYINKDNTWTSKPEIIDRASVESVNVATEENILKLSGAAGWGLAGGLLLGPAGLIAGALLGGRKKKTIFVLILKDGRKLIAECKSKDFPQILAYGF